MVQRGCRGRPSGLAQLCAKLYQVSNENLTGKQLGGRPSQEAGKKGHCEKSVLGDFFRSTHLLIIRV